MLKLDDFNHQISGNTEGPKLVFLHGLMGSGANWRKITPSFEGRAQILTYDQRGHGRSVAPESGYTPEDYADDLRMILNELGWEKVYLVGHSLGGRNAQNFTFRFPERVIGLVVEDIGPVATDAAARNIEHLLSLVPTPFADKKQAREFFRHRFAGLIPDNPRAQVLSQYFYTNIEEKQGGQADWRFSKAGVLASVKEGRRRDRWDEISGLSVPTLFVRGDMSADLDRLTFDKILASNELITGVEIADAGHWVHFDQPEKFIQCISEFFALHGFDNPGSGR